MLNLFKTLLRVLFGIVSLVLVLYVALSLGKFAIYNEYYQMESNICVNPGLNDGFVCQGVCASEESGKILVCGYMDDKSNSRIYVVDIETNEYYHVRLEREGKKYTGHAGGIATTGDTVYIANGSKLYVFDISALLSAKNGDTVDIGAGVPVNNAASYVYCDEDYIYVGEFHHTEGDNEKEHNYDSKEGMHHAIITRYTHEQITGYDGENDPTPDKIYSVRAKVQGVCFTPDGKVVLSTSYGRFNSSKYYVYDEQDARDSGETLNGAPVYVLENAINEITGPAMSEDMDYYNGKVITLSEVAANKYFYGKLFFADDVVGLEIK